jgi:hypothetical protein
MQNSVSEIVERLFARAADDAGAAPLTDRFARIYHEGQWTAERLDAEVRDFVDADPPYAEVSPGEGSAGSS